MHLRSAVIKQLSFVGCVVLLACAIETFAHDREWYSYRVELTSTGGNEYVDGESGITVMTSDCSLAYEGSAYLMISVKSRSGWLTFDDGASCDVTGLIRDEDETDSQDPDDSPDPDDGADQVFGMLT